MKHEIHSGLNLKKAGPLWHVATVDKDLFYTWEPAPWHDATVDKDPLTGSVLESSYED